MQRPIIYYGNALLRTQCKAVERIDQQLIQLVNDMIETMDASSGIGIAAPQVGVGLRLFVLRNYLDDESNSLSAPLVYINPKIIKVSKEAEEDVEGCLSIPGLRAKVRRPSKITIEAMDLSGRVFTEEIEGYNARVRLHENDHINGVLFIDRLPARVKKKIEPELKVIKERFSSK